MQTLTETKTQLPRLTHTRNPGMALDLDWVASVQANTSAIERRANTLGGRRSVKKEFQAAWLLKAISLIDLTTLSGDDTEGRVKRLCAKARQPVAPWMLDKLGLQGLTTGAVCVYHEMVGTAVRALEGTNIPVAAVSTGFPAGLSPYHLRIAEIGESVRAGAKEIDIRSRAAMSSAETGKRFTMKCPRCAPPVARRMSKPFSPPENSPPCATSPAPVLSA